ncbi:MAG: hypothetical protein WCB50_12570, partial [Pseudolabrys sp.]
YKPQMFAWRQAPFRVVRMRKRTTPPSNLKTLPAGSSCFLWKPGLSSVDALFDAVLSSCYSRRRLDVHVVNKIRSPREQCKSGPAAFAAVIA